MNLTPKIREEAIFKAVALDKQISRIQLTRRITNRKFFTDEMGSSEPPDPKMADGGNSYEVEKNCCLAIRCNKVWRKSMEMKQKLISFPGQAVFCGECGCLIDRERVEEVPHTAHCVKCKNSHNGNGHNGS
ncbi:MAG: hypothetical protein PHW15_02290 [Patescibacteria group bacterium]|nr:hypothetical protein [Patescibacteria group bacterium]MDD5173091.1 hypothetical protein [Patescibacteria group bacterium]